ncbi:O-antigen ligase family protein [uncultured Hymenobacter sp.]|uniref:O-antigen ligase family protein n=1 Tax=uncultured Hymenobacter sp. TaxID=170016 RepID=UPI0035CB5342
MIHLARLRPQDNLQWSFVAFIGVLLASGAAALVLEQPAALLPALAFVGALVCVLQWRWLYYLLFVLLPFSREVSLPGGLSMDVPSEPLMLALTACVGLSLLLRGGQPLGRRELLHPLVIILALMLVWTAADTPFSVDTKKSVKYLLAKVWYLTPFLLGTLLIIRRPAQVWGVVAAYAGSSVLAVLYVLPRHAAAGFSFAEINHAVAPIFRNHVTYATVLALLLPFTWYGAQASGRGLGRWAWRGGVGILLLGLLTSYTRASWLSLPVAGLYYYFVLRRRLTVPLLLAAALSFGGLALYFSEPSRFMRFAPDYEKTIFNGDNFEKHLAATYKLEDVSGMERVYRWVAASRMIADRPITGSGPATFYPEYKRYTISGFRTYVSDNPEKSTTHNYFLLQLAEQGLPGFLLFCLLLSAALLLAERLYHRTRVGAHRQVVLAATLSLVIIVFHLLLNELLEVDKIGSVFFVCLALLIRAESWIAEEEPA